MKKLWFICSLLLLTAFAQAQQFRLSSQGAVSLLSTPDDSTYVVQVVFDGDLTGNSFFPNSIQVGYRLFSQREQLYHITNVANADASQADLTIRELDNSAVDTEGVPIGEVMVYDPGSTGEIPQVPFGSTGAGSNLQAAVVSYNSRLFGSGGDVKDERLATDNQTLTGPRLLDFDGNAHTWDLSEMPLDGLAWKVLTPDGKVLGWYIADGAGDVKFIVDGVLTSDFQNIFLHADERITVGGQENQLFFKGRKVFFELDSLDADQLLNKVIGIDPVTGEMKEVELGSINSKLDTAYVARNIQASEVQSLSDSKDVNFTLSLSDTVTQDYTLILPVVDSISAFDEIVYGDYLTNNLYAIQTQGQDLIRLGNTDRFTTKYFIDRGEKVSITKQGGVYQLQTSQSPVDKFFIEDFLDGTYYERSVFKFKDATYTTSKTPPNGVNPSNIFVTKVRDKAPFGENLLFKSNNFAHGSFTTNWSINRDEMRSAVTSNLNAGIRDIAPDGTNTATIFPFVGVSNFNIQQIVTDLVFDSLEYVTVSIYARYRGAGTGSIKNVFITDRSGFVLSSNIAGPEVLDTTLTRYTFLLQMTRSPLTPSVSFDFEGQDGDTLTLAFAQAERVSIASTYKPTGIVPQVKVLKSDSVFSSLNLINSFVDLNGIYRPTDNDDELLRQAIAYCEGIEDGGGICEGVVLADGMTFTEGEILIPEEFTLKGRGRNQTTVYANLPDSTKSLFILRDDPGAYVAYVTVKDFSVEALDTTALFFECRHTFDVVFENMGMDGSSMTDYLIKIGETGQLGALTSTLRECFLQAATNANILYERCGNLHRIEGGTSGRSFAGVACYTDIGSLVITGWDAENNNMAFDFSQATGGRIAIEGYFEQKSGEPERDFEFGSFGAISFRDCFLTMDRWGFGENPGAISFDGCSFNTGVNFESIQENPLYKGIFIPGPTWEPNSLSVTNCAFVRGTNAEKLRSTYGDKWWFHFDGGSSTKDGGNYGVISSVVNNLESEESRFVESSFEGILGGEIGAANLSFAGADENLATWSDSTNVVDDAAAKIYWNAAVNPITKDTTFEIVTSKITENTNRNLVRLYLEESIQPGDAFTLSFYAKSLGDSTNAAFRVFTEEGAGIQGIVSRDYRRYTIAVDSSSSTYSSLLVQYRNRLAGDSIAIGGWQVNRGRKATPHVPTFGQGSLAGGVAKIGGNMLFTGDFQRTDRAEGTESNTTDGTGDVTITHSLGFTPTNINITPLGTGGSPLLPQVLSNTINSTTFTVRWFTPSTGAPATSEAVEFHWSAE